MPTDIGRDDVDRLLRHGAQLVEVLPREEYEEAHLPGALHIPLRAVDTQGPAVLDRARPIIVYCWDSA